MILFRMVGDPNGAWATCLGRPGESAELVITDLRKRFGERIEIDVVEDDQ